MIIEFDNVFIIEELILFKLFEVEYVLFENLLFVCRMVRIILSVDLFGNLGCGLMGIL